MGGETLDCVGGTSSFGEESIQPQPRIKRSLPLSRFYRNAPESALSEVLVFDHDLKPSAIRCKHRPCGLYVSKPQLLYSWAHRCKPSGNLSSGPAANAPIYSRVSTSSAILMLSNSLPDPPICLPGPLHSTFPFIATIHIALAGSSPTLAASSPGSNPIIANHSERVVCLITRSAG